MLSLDDPLRTAKRNFTFATPQQSRRHSACNINNTSGLALSTPTGSAGLPPTALTSNKNSPSAATAMSYNNNMNNAAALLQTPNSRLVENMSSILCAGPSHVDMSPDLLTLGQRMQEGDHFLGANRNMLDTTIPEAEQPTMTHHDVNNNNNNSNMSANHNNVIDSLEKSSSPPLMRSATEIQPPVLTIRNSVDATNPPSTHLSSCLAMLSGRDLGAITPVYTQRPYPFLARDMEGSKHMATAVEEEEEDQPPTCKPPSSKLAAFSWDALTTPMQYPDVTEAQPDAYDRAALSALETLHACRKSLQAMDSACGYYISGKKQQQQPVTGVVVGQPLITSSQATNPNVVTSPSLEEAKFMAEKSKASRLLYYNSVARRTHLTNDLSLTRSLYIAFMKSGEAPPPRSQQRIAVKGFYPCAAGPQSHYSEDSASCGKPKKRLHTQAFADANNNGEDEDGLAAGIPMQHAFLASASVGLRSDRKNNIHHHVNDLFNQKLPSDYQRMQEGKTTKTATTNDDDEAEAARALALLSTVRVLRRQTEDLTAQLLHACGEWGCWETEQADSVATLWTETSSAAREKMANASFFRDLFDTSELSQAEFTAARNEHIVSLSLAKSSNNKEAFLNLYGTPFKQFVPPPPSVSTQLDLYSVYQSALHAAEKRHSSSDSKADAAGAGADADILGGIQQRLKRLRRLRRSRCRALRDMGIVSTSQQILTSPTTTSTTATANSYSGDFNYAAQHAHHSLIVQQPQHGGGSAPPPVQRRRTLPPFSTGGASGRPINKNYGPGSRGIDSDDPNTDHSHASKPSGGGALQDRTRAFEDSNNSSSMPTFKEEGGYHHHHHHHHGDSKRPAGVISRGVQHSAAMNQNAVKGSSNKDSRVGQPRHAQAHAALPTNSSSSVDSEYSVTEYTSSSSGDGEASRGGKKNGKRLRNKPSGYAQSWMHAMREALMPAVIATSSPIRAANGGRSAKDNFAEWSTESSSTMSPCVERTRYLVAQLPRAVRRSERALREVLSYVDDALEAREQENAMSNEVRVDDDDAADIRAVNDLNALRTLKGQLQHALDKRLQRKQEREEEKKIQKEQERKATEKSAKADAAAAAPAPAAAARKGVLSVESILQDLKSFRESRSRSPPHDRNTPGAHQEEAADGAPRGMEPPRRSGHVIDDTMDANAAARGKNKPKRKRSLLGRVFCCSS